MMTGCVLAVVASATAAVPKAAPTAVVDAFVPANPGEVKIGGWLGERISRNVTGRLKHAPIEEMLAGFAHRPGNHPWIGEHIGKWLHAAALGWEYTHDAELRGMMDDAVSALVKTQEADGYLGTYLPKDRWTSWDVWVHKYNLIGLLAYYRISNDEKALTAARRIGDLLVETFGPGRRSIIEAGTHVGMAATSVLEPMVKLYELTGEPRYLAFCDYLVESWNEPNGPHVLYSLLARTPVGYVANGKAYELMSNLVGLCELYRVTGRKEYFDAVNTAWNDIYSNQLTITGGTSYGEYFLKDQPMPLTGPVAETCADVTWMQLSLELLRLRGQPQYAEAIDRLVHNHLLAAQADDGEDWCYFTPLRGRKEFRSDINCCHSSGPRGVALIPTVFYGKTLDGIQINLIGPSEYKTTLPNGVGVTIHQQTQLPAENRVLIEVAPEKPTKFTLAVRIPFWSRRYDAAVNGEPLAEQRQRLIPFDREWQAGDTVTIWLQTEPTWIVDAKNHVTELAVRKGPYILCASQRWNPEILTDGLFPVNRKLPLAVPASVPGDDARLGGYFASVTDAQTQRTLLLGPYAFVQRELFTVWLPEDAETARSPMSLLLGGKEGWSREGNRDGRIADGDPSTFRVTYDGTRQDEDWYQVSVDNPVSVSRIAFFHGHTYPNGGWFDTSEGKPKVFVRKEPKGEWVPVGELDSYPETNATDDPHIEDGQMFALSVEPMTIYGVRISGKPACGVDENQAFSSCGEIAAYAK